MTETPRSRLILCRNDPTQAEPLAALLTDHYDIFDAPSHDDALDALEREGAECLLLMGDGGGVSFLNAVAKRDRTGACRVVLVGDTSDALVSAAQAGCHFVALPDVSDPRELLDHLQALGRGRAYTRRPARAGFALRGRTAEGAPFCCALLDVSHHGLAFHLKATDDLGPFLPGCRLSRLVVEGEATVALRAEEAVVRHVWPLGREEGCPDGYRIGVRLGDAEHSDPEASWEIRDVVHKAGALQAGVEMGEVRVTLAGDDTAEITCDRAQSCAGGDHVVVSGIGAGSGRLHRGDVVQVTFEVRGARHLFVAAVAHATATDKRTTLSLWPPRVIQATRLRATTRHQPTLAAQLRVDARTVLGTQVEDRPVVDLSSVGVAFVVYPGVEVFPVGAAVESLILHLPDGRELRGSGWVRSLAPLPDYAGHGPGAHKCGLSLEGFSEDDRNTLTNAIIGDSAPGIEDATGLPFETLWTCMQRSGFLYPEKEARLQPSMGSLRRTVEALLAVPNQLCKTLVFRHQGELMGHVSAVKVFSGTWMVQHLAVARARDPSAAQTPRIVRYILKAISEYFVQIPEMTWVKVFYRPTNPWAALVFGTIARRMQHLPMVDLRTYDYLAAPRLDGAAPVVPDVEVRDAAPADLVAVERCFVTLNLSVLMRSDALHATALTLDGLDGEYQGLGLQRCRRILVAYRGAVMTAFALLPLTSVGLNFSELANAVQLFRCPSVGDGDDDAVRALLWRIREIHRELGRAHSIALSAPEQTELLASCGFVRSKSYVAWTWHRSLVQTFYEYTLRATTGRSVNRDA